MGGVGKRVIQLSKFDSMQLNINYQVPMLDYIEILETCEREIVSNTAYKSRSNERVTDSPYNSITTRFNTRFYSILPSFRN